MVRGAPESKAVVDKDYRFDTIGVSTFMVTMAALIDFTRKPRV